MRKERGGRGMSERKREKSKEWNEQGMKTFDDKNLSVLGRKLH